MKFVNTVCLCLITTVVFIQSAPSVNNDGAENSVLEGSPQTSDATATESKGYFQYITDTVKEYTVNKVLDMFKSIPVECKSKISKKSGKLKATKKGKRFCEKKCITIYEKIDNAKEAIKTIRSYLPFAQTLQLKPRQLQNSPKFKCSRNLTGTKLICDCPQAPQFSFGKSLQKYLEKTFLEPSKASRDKHKYKNWYPPPYGYGGGPPGGPFGGPSGGLFGGPGGGLFGGLFGHHGYQGGYGGYSHPYGYSPFGNFISMIVRPLKMLFIIVTLPFWVFLAAILGLELDDILD